MDRSTDADEHLPADDDWPIGAGESSVWPAAVVAATTGIYLGVALFLLGGHMRTLVGMVGGVVALGSVAALVGGAGGWAYQAFVTGTKEVVNEQAHEAGMILFIATDIATFSAGFVYYFFVRLGRVWPPQHMPAGLLSSLLAANTAALLLGSLSYYVAERRLARNDRRGFLAGVAGTALLGALFLAGQAYEYIEFVTREGFVLASGIYASAFYALTGLHGLHVLLGVILVSVVVFRGVRGEYAPDEHLSVTTVGWYWHFVDVVWLILVSSLYLGSQVSLPGL